MADRLNGGQARRGKGPADELRKLMIADQRKRFGPGSRWHLPGVPCESLDALESGEPVIASSEEIFSALFHAGLPHDDFVYGGKYFRGEFLLDTDGSITEYVEDDEGARR